MGEMDGGPGADWIEQVRATYEEVGSRLWRAVLAWSGSADVADESVAEAFTQLVRRGSVVRDPAGWVWQASFRIAAGDLQQRRQEARRRVPHEHGDAQVAALVGPPDRLPDEALDLVRALAKLSDQQRRCVALVDVAGHTAPSAASVLGTTTATVRVQLMRARRRLRNLLSEQPDEIAATATRNDATEDREADR